jgi:hypothetical protein
MARPEHPTSIRLTAADKRRLRKHADKYKHSLAGLIQMILLQWLEQQEKKNDEGRGDTEFYKALRSVPPEAQTNSYNWCGGVVDGLVDLEILKLDSVPTNPLEALALSMGSAMSSGPLTAAKVAGHLEALGFAVVKT